MAQRPNAPDIQPINYGAVELAKQQKLESEMGKVATVGGVALKSAMDSRMAMKALDQLKRDYGKSGEKFDVPSNATPDQIATWVDNYMTANEIKEQVAAKIQEQEEKDYRGNNGDNRQHV